MFKSSFQQHPASQYNVTRTEVGESRQTVNVFIDSGQSLIQSLSVHLHICRSLQRPQEQLQDR